MMNSVVPMPKEASARARRGRARVRLRCEGGCCNALCNVFGLGAPPVLACQRHGGGRRRFAPVNAQITSGACSKPVRTSSACRLSSLPSKPPVLRKRRRPAPSQTLRWSRPCCWPLRAGARRSAIPSSSTGSGIASPGRRCGALCRTLDAIDAAGAAAGEPNLAVLVVREADGLPGQGWWTGGPLLREGYEGAWTGAQAAAFVRERQERAFARWAEPKRARKRPA